MNLEQVLLKKTKACLQNKSINITYILYKGLTINYRLTQFKEF